MNLAIYIVSYGSYTLPCPSEYGIILCSKIYYIYIITNLDKLKRKPILQLLSRTKRHFATHWRDIGYEFLTATPEDVQTIERTNKTEDEKCFDMLKRWVETDADASYSKLIDALHEYDLNDAAKKIMDKIEAL